MKTKALAQYSGILGLVGGIYLLVFAPFILLFAVASSAVTAAATQAPEPSAFAAVLSIFFPLILKIALLVMGIVAIVHYKGDARVGAAPSILLILAGAIGIIPALGWVGGILAIIGGSLFLAALKKFKVEEEIIDQVEEA